MDFDQAAEIERKLANLGLNPMFGEWQRKFTYPAVSYSSPNRMAFRSRLHTDLSDVKFYFSHDIKLEITVYQLEQKRLETPDYGDLDNYAKSVCDSIKGRAGFLFDDCQIQSIDICWMTALDQECFEIGVRASPDDFVLKPVTFYEMPNGLFYPLSRNAWTEDGAKAVSDGDLSTILPLLSKMIGNARKRRHDLRQAGSEPLHAFWYSHILQPTIQGYHKSRIVDGGFSFKTRLQWESGDL